MRIQKQQITALLIMLILLLSITITGVAEDDGPPPRHPANYRDRDNPVPLLEDTYFNGLDETVLDEFISTLGDTSTDTPKIIGGYPVSPQNAYPWMVSLQYFKSHYCGGTLIDPQWVLTAAHCWADSNGVPYDVWVGEDTVVIGEYSLAGISGLEQRINVSEVFIHPDFNPQVGLEFDNDVALLKLAAPATLNSFVQTVSLVGETYENSDFLYKIGKIAGWGATNIYWDSCAYKDELNQCVGDWAYTYPDVMQNANVNFIADSICEDPSSYGTDFDAATMICAGMANGTRDSCSGDSGGPLFFDRDGTYVQVGITSWGKLCALQNYPGVYAKIAPALDWILSTTQIKPKVKPTLVSPINGQTVYTGTPSFKWKEVSFATAYALMVKDSGGNVVFVRGLDAGTYCSTGTCQFDDITALSHGTYTWIVAPKNDSGYGGGSSTTFKVSFTPNVAPVLVSPINGATVATSTPSFKWNEVPLATVYALMVKDSGGNVEFVQGLNAGTYCSSGTCQFDDIPALPEDTYTWIIAPKNEYGYGPGSSTTFKVSLRPNVVPTLVSPINGATVATSTPSFKWNEVPLATLYALMVKDSGGNVVFVQGLNAGTYCSAGVCQFDEISSLSAGNYTWIIAPKNEYGYGPGNSTTFKISFTPNVAPTLISPINGVTVATSTPSFKWNEVPLATIYALMVKDSGGNVVFVKGLNAGTYCSSGTCQFDDIPALPEDTYLWIIAPKNEYGYGPGNSSSFKVTFTPPNVVPTLVSPINGETVSTSTPSFIWNEVPLATIYALMVKDSGGNVVFVQGLNAGTYCSSGTCQFDDIPSLSSGSYTWIIAPKNDQGYGPGNSSTFVVAP